MGFDFMYVILELYYSRHKFDPKISSSSESKIEKNIFNKKLDTEKREKRLGHTIKFRINAIF